MKTRPSPKLILPDVVEVQLVIESEGRSRILELSEVAVRVNTFRCQKNDYHLGPFFSNSDGVVVISQDDLNDSIRDHWAIGLMDFAEISTCATEIEIHVCTAEDLSKEEDTRRNIWRTLLPGEVRHYSSIEELIRRLKAASNHRLKSPTKPIRDCWDGRQSTFKYSVGVDLE